MSSFISLLISKVLIWTHSQLLVLLCLPFPSAVAELGAEKVAEMKAAKAAAEAAAAMAAEKRRIHADNVLVVEGLMKTVMAAAMGLSDFDRTVWLASASAADLPHKLSKKDAQGLFGLTNARLPPGEKSKLIFQYGALKYSINVVSYALARWLAY